MALVAQSILDEVERLQTANERSAEWEIKLVELVREKTSLIEISDFENLMHLQRQRHLSAHPVLVQGYELHRPNKETVRALIRNTLDGVLIKPPVYTRKIFTEFISDLSTSSSILIDKSKLKKYIESKYLSRTDTNIEVSLFRSLWKFVFRLANEECEKNRTINYWALEILFERSSTDMIKEIESDKDYYTNIANTGRPITFLVYFLSKKSPVYSSMTDAAKMIIHHICELDTGSRCISWFLKPSLQQHSDDLISWIDSDTYPTLADTDIPLLFDISDSPEWKESCQKVLNSYYTASRGYDSADTRFFKGIRSYLKGYTESTLTDLMLKAQSNSQAYDRRGAKYDHRLVIERCNELLGADYDYTPYNTFVCSTE
jgi:hypothetical protein